MRGSSEPPEPPALDPPLPVPFSRDSHLKTLRNMFLNLEKKSSFWLSPGQTIKHVSCNMFHQTFCFIELLGLHDIS